MTDNPGFNGNQGFQPGYGPSGGGQPRGQGYSQPGQGYPAQGYQPQGQGYQQGQPPQQPGQGFQQPGQGFTAPAPKKGPSKLVVLVCILAALCLLLSAGLVYMFVNQDKSDITKGIVPVGELLELEIPELDAKAFSPYTLFLPGEDAAVVIMQTANGAKMQKFITATTKKTAEKVGDLIDLPACPTNSTRPYVVKGSDVVCSEKPVIVKNENKNYEFNETVYTSETIIIGASPSAAAATQIVAYQPGKEEPLWVENLNTPASVSTNGETIYTATTNEDGKIDIQGYVGAEKQDKTETAKPSKEALAPDFMKNYDFANTFVPEDGNQSEDPRYARCSGKLYIPVKGGFPDQDFHFNLMPDNATDCWIELANGRPKANLIPGQSAWCSESSTDCNTKMIFGELSKYARDSDEVETSSNGIQVAYTDANEDGYLDAVMIGYPDDPNDDLQRIRILIFLANPNNPEHPYVGLTSFWPIDHTGLHTLVGTFTIEDKPGTISAEGSRIKIEGNAEQQIGSLELIER